MRLVLLPLIALARPSLAYKICASRDRGHLCACDAAVQSEAVACHPIGGQAFVVDSVVSMTTWSGTDCKGSSIQINQTWPNGCYDVTFGSIEVREIDDEDEE
ncbi:hypothetical protein CC78DRAFT_575477 [Lojkania enalia]|uniref:Uncharacterized protein n=1 Tax=Lojkania enalia TaxID=147567 RepID=A0A9P4N8F2_9PLEO|nr:hypothetical protein CC78DRAFT_575477 [Didymosphaeria enalia]